jgi:mevalonate kinase
VSRQRSFAPGKLIISGEHAVVHGAPAIAMAVDCGAKAMMDLAPSPHTLFTLLLPDLNYRETQTPEALLNLYEVLNLHYAEFQSGQRNINDVLHEPADLLWYAIGYAIFNHDVHIPGELVIEIHANIPVGCGMGSSAAITAALLCGLFAVWGKHLQPDELFTMVHHIEQLQHGTSSGLDPCVVTQGGCIWFQEGKYHSVNIQSNPFYFINTGRPDSSTGECVHVASQAFKDKTLIKSFSDCTEKIARDLQAGDLRDLKTYIRENHRLLCDIGVVPLAIQKLVSAIEEAGGAAKICGAGSVKGDQAGMLLVIEAEEVVKKAGFQHFPVEFSEIGAIALSEG